MGICTAIFEKRLGKPRYSWDVENAPATVSISTRPAGHAKDRYAIPDEWLRFVADINGGSKSLSYKALMRKGAGWNNVGTLEAPKIESLAWWGSVMELSELYGRYARIKTFDFRSTPPSAAAFNYESHPELIQQFTSINDKGQMFLLGRGYRAYSILLSRGPLWVPLDRIEVFPELPMRVEVTIGILNIRANPTLSAKRVGRLRRGRRPRVFEYAVRGPSVWGRIRRGWIAISLGNRALRFTSWGMKTIPAI